MTDPKVQNSGKPKALALLGHLRGDGLSGRIATMLLLALLLLVPLRLIGGIVSDQMRHESEAAKAVGASWGGPLTVVGPTVKVPYRRSSGTTEVDGTLVLLPDKLQVDARLHPEQRRRGIFAVNVYRAVLEVSAQFNVRPLQDLQAEGRRIDWKAMHLAVDLGDARSAEGSAIDVNGLAVDWQSASVRGNSVLTATLSPERVDHQGGLTVRFQIELGGSGSLAIAPLGRRTEATMGAAWQSPSYFGRLPFKQEQGADGFRASWSQSDLGRPYGQLWDIGSDAGLPAGDAVRMSAFGVALLPPIDTYREIERALKYDIMIVGLTFALCLLFELATGIAPHGIQYGLIGLSLSIYYLLLLSFSERWGFTTAYAISATAVVLQVAGYNWALQRRSRPALAFGALLALLFAGLYGLLRLEDIALLAGSLVLFAVVSVAMWLTRDLHRRREA